MAEALDRAEALRAKRRAALAQLETLTQAIFLDMFGDPLANPKEWKRVPFGDTLERIDSGRSPLCLDRPAHADEWGVLKLGAVTRCEFDPSENKALPTNVEPDPGLEVRVGDLLFTRKNTHQLVAACALVRDTRRRLLLPDLIFRLRLKREGGVRASYLQSLLTYPTKRALVQKLAGGSAGSMPNISKGRLEKLAIEVPPMGLQIEYERRLDAITATKRRSRLSLGEFDALFGSLQDRAFTGRL
jgi:type I restriction enzyme S subunit